MDAHSAAGAQLLAAETANTLFAVDAGFPFRHGDGVGRAGPGADAAAHAGPILQLRPGLEDGLHRALHHPADRALPADQLGEPVPPGDIPEVLRPESGQLPVHGDKDELIGMLYDVDVLAALLGESE